MPNRARSQARSNTFATAMEEPIDLPRGALGEHPLKWLKEYDRVANFNKWDDMMCLSNVYFFLDGTARQWYVNNEDTLDSWEAFKKGLSGLLATVKNIPERQKNNKNPGVQRSGEIHIPFPKFFFRTLPEVKPGKKEDKKSVTPLKGVAGNIYGPLLTKK
ncbi:CCHC-type domain-containing protein [Trichonephila inaurata madagascariensis]|uniref:CCHC-type domain-containing protein n=1 Tax=Trichonephila inaurata madagascariensis TaxID=2747483 RepID=A0A8X6X0B7_9ARAC|nr:CCHC-type domain-containing protein [Trichonephila inaurata madagascariensis]